MVVMLYNVFWLLVLAALWKPLTDRFVEERFRGHEMSHELVVGVHFITSSSVSGLGSVIETMAWWWSAVLTKMFAVDGLIHHASRINMRRMLLFFKFMDKCCECLFAHGLHM